MNEIVGFLGTSAIVLLVGAAYLGGTGFVLFLLDKIMPAKQQD